LPRAAGPRRASRRCAAGRKHGSATPATSRRSPGRRAPQRSRAKAAGRSRPRTHERDGNPRQPASRDLRAATPTLRFAASEAPGAAGRLRRALRSLGRLKLWIDHLEAAIRDRLLLADSPRSPSQIVRQAAAWNPSIVPARAPPVLDLERSDCPRLVTNSFSSLSISDPRIRRQWITNSKDFP
jgi:hypothetical protein